MSEDTVHTLITPETGDIPPPSAPQKSGTKRKWEYGNLPLLRVSVWTGKQTAAHDAHLGEELIPHLLGLGATEARVIRIDPDHWALITRWKSRKEYSRVRSKRLLELLSNDAVAERFPGVSWVSVMIGKPAEDWLSVIDGTHPDDLSVVSMPEVIAP